MKSKIFSIIAESMNCPAERLTMDTNVVIDLGADSLDVMDIAIRFEEEFKISFIDDDYRKMETIKDIYELIIQKVEKK